MLETSMPALAKTVDDLTPEWLSQVLGSPVSSLRTTPIGTGQMSAVLRVDAGYADGGQGSFVAKLASTQEEVRQTGHGLGLYLTEVQFYREIAPVVDINVPRTWFADIDPGSGWFTLLMEYNDNARVGDNLAEGTVADAAAALEQLVGLHAPRWADPKLRAIDWLGDTNWLALVSTFPDSLAPFLDRFGDELTTDEVKLCEQVMPQALPWVQAWSGPFVLQHGDFRPDNVLFEPQPDGSSRLTVIDWQTTRVGPALIDVSFYVGGSLATDDRRAHEEELIRGYHEGLQAAGVTGYLWDQCWDDYRRTALYGLLCYVGVFRHIESTERGDRLFLDGFRRFAAQALDLDAMRYLP